MTKQPILEMCKEHFNEPIISHSEIVRLIGYGETAIDCYLICSSMSRGVYWNTAVGGYTFLDRLKGQQHVRSTEGENWDDFVRLDKELELNGAPKVEEFITDIRPDDYEGGKPMPDNGWNDWAVCEHEWQELVDSQFHSENETEVKCEKCGCPGSKGTKTGDVFWPAT